MNFEGVGPPLGDLWGDSTPLGVEGSKKLKRGGPRCLTIANGM